MPNVKRTKMPKQKHVSMQVICLLDKNTHLKSIFDYHKASLVSQSSYCFRFGLPTACARKESNSRFNCDINRLYSVAYIPNLHYMRSQMPCYSRNVSEISSYDAAWISSNARSQTTNNNARLAFFFLCLTQTAFSTAAVVRIELGRDHTFWANHGALVSALPSVDRVFTPVQRGYTHQS